MENNGWMPCMNCMMNMQPMMQEPMMQQPMIQMPMMQEPMMQQPMMQQPMMEIDMEEENLKMMYPGIYGRIMPLVKQHCDKHEERHGTMYCPKREDIEHMRDEIYENIEDELDDEFGEDDEHDDDKRIRRYGRRGAVKDLVGVLLLNELIGRRRRRRRRRPRPRPHYGWGWY